MRPQLIVLLIILILLNYKSYCISPYKSDTVEVIKFHGQLGIFIDSSAAAKLTKKTMLSDSLLRINIFNEGIILRQSIQINNGKQIENNFQNYVINSDKEKEELNKKFNLKLLGKNIVIGLQTTAILILGTLYLLK